MGAGSPALGTSVFGLGFPGQPVLDVKFQLVLPLSCASTGGKEYQIREGVCEPEFGKDALRLKEHNEIGSQIVKKGM